MLESHQGAAFAPRKRPCAGLHHWGTEAAGVRRRQVRLPLHQQHVQAWWLMDRPVPSLFGACISQSNRWMWWCCIAAKPISDQKEPLSRRRSICLSTRSTSLRAGLHLSNSGQSVACMHAQCMLCWWRSVVPTRSHAHGIRSSSPALARVHIVVAAPSGRTLSSFSSFSKCVNLESCCSVFIPPFFVLCPLIQGPVLFANLSL